MSQIPASGSQGQYQPVTSTTVPLAGYSRFRKPLDFGNAATNCFDFEDPLASLCSPVVPDGKGRLNLIAKPVYIVDPCQNGTTPLRTMTLLSSTAGDAAAFGAVALGRYQRIDTPTVVNSASLVLDFSNYGYHGVSATNTAQTAAFDTKGLAAGLSIKMSTSAGTATLAVHGSMDNFVTQDIDIDDVAAAGSTVKNYDRGHADVGATVAVSPLNWRFLKVTAGTAGVGNTTTLDIAMK